jgi:hypothetical protein
MLRKVLISIGIVLAALGPALFVLFPITEDVVSIGRYVIPPERGEMVTIRASPEGEGVGGGDEAPYLKKGNNFSISFMFFGCNSVNVTFRGHDTVMHQYNWTDINGRWLSADFTLPYDISFGWLYESDRTPYERIWTAYISYQQKVTRSSPLNVAYFAFSIVGSAIIGILTTVKAKH